MAGFHRMLCRLSKRDPLRWGCVRCTSLQRITSPCKPRCSHWRGLASPPEPCPRPLTTHSCGHVRLLNLPSKYVG
eukprot:14186634-Alexandrium_andersonii.AAC.2